jgi:hypothetical protein
LSPDMRRAHVPLGISNSLSRVMLWMGVNPTTASATAAPTATTDNVSVRARKGYSFNKSVRSCT